MPLDPQAEAYLQQIATVPAWYELPVEDVRKQRVLMAPTMNGPAEPVKQVENCRIPGPAGEIPIRIYTPQGETPLPVFIYFHGGGWVLSDVDTHDTLCRKLANRSSCIVVSVDYRLAPEHKFPAAVEDSYAATCWVAENACSFDGNPTQIVVGGDSAGGNLSAVVTQIAREQKGPALTYQVLIYPATDYFGDAVNNRSYQQNGEGYFLTTEGVSQFLHRYLNNEEEGKDPRFAPLRAESLADLPPALIITAEFDPLLDEGELYAKRLQEAGVPVILRRYPGMIHGFFNMAAVISKANQAIDETGETLRQELRKRA